MGATAYRARQDIAVLVAAGSFRARLRDADGQWAVLRTSPLVGVDDDQIAVIIQPT